MKVDDIHRLMALGAELQLSHAIYGPAGAKHGGFLDQTMPYYRFLAGLCRAEQVRTVLEIGTHFGGSTLALIEGMRAGLPGNECAALALRLVTMDVERLNDEALSQYPEVVRVDGSSTDPVALDAAVSELPSPQVDLLYIDALKSRDFVATTLALLSKRIVPRVIVLDDTAINASMRQMWREVCDWFGKANVTQLSDLVPEVRDPQTGFGMVRVRPGLWPVELGQEQVSKSAVDLWQLEPGRTWRADKLMEHLAYRAVLTGSAVCHMGEAGQESVMSLARGMSQGAPRPDGSPARLQVSRIPPKGGWTEEARRAVLTQCQEASLLGVLLDGVRAPEASAVGGPYDRNLLVVSSDVPDELWPTTVCAQLSELRAGRGLLVLPDFGQPGLRLVDAMLGALAGAFDVLAFAQPVLVLGLRGSLSVDVLQRVVSSLAKDSARVSAVIRWAQAGLPADVEATALVKVLRLPPGKRGLAAEHLAERLGTLRPECTSPTLLGRIDKLLSSVPAQPSAGTATSAE